MNIIGKRSFDEMQGPVYQDLFHSRAADLPSMIQSVTNAVRRASAHLFYSQAGLRIFNPDFDCQPMTRLDEFLEYAGQRGGYSSKKIQHIERLRDELRSSFEMAKIDLNSANTARINRLNSDLAAVAKGS